MLLFLKNVERMSVYEWSSGQSEPQQVTALFCSGWLSLLLEGYRGVDILVEKKVVGLKYHSAFLMQKKKKKREKRHMRQKGGEMSKNKQPVLLRNTKYFFAFFALRNATRRRNSLCSWVMV